jgi:flagellar biogenesis protein FliO
MPVAPKIGIWAFAGTLLAAAIASAQQSAPSHYVESRPVQQSAESRFPVRLAAAEEPATTSTGTAPLRLAPRQLSSDARRIDRPIMPTPTGAVGTVVGSLAIVLGLFLVLAWCSRRFAPAGSAQLPKEALELLGRSSLSPRQQVQLVRLGNKLLLVALTPAGAETLTEITDAAEVERLTGLCRRGQPASASNSFAQALGELTREPAPSGFVGGARRGSRGAA